MLSVLSKVEGLKLTKLLFFWSKKLFIFVIWDSKKRQGKKERLIFSEAEDPEDAEVGECQAYDLELQVDDVLPLTDFPWYVIQILYSIEYSLHDIKDLFL